MAAVMAVPGAAHHRRSVIYFQASGCMMRSRTLCTKRTTAPSCRCSMGFLVRGLEEWILSTSIGGGNLMTVISQ
ncbi:hypothetical protein U1Q18_013639, partial [Sarracenia purpurea var. burkii]